jgi:uncharacterized membrane protein YhaH (DUF805 family)
MEFVISLILAYLIIYFVVLGLDVFLGRDILRKSLKQDKMLLFLLLYPIILLSIPLLKIIAKKLKDRSDKLIRK